MFTDNQITSILNFLETSTGLWAVIGALIAGAATPIIGGIIDSRKMKRSIQPELIKEIHEHFVVMACKIVLVNNNALKVRILNLLAVRIDNTSTPDDVRQEARRSQDSYQQAILSETISINDYSKMLIQSQSQILVLLSKIKFHFGTKKYEEVCKYLNPIIWSEEVNMKFHLYDFKTESEDRIIQIQHTIEKELHDHTIEINKQCRALIEQITISLK